MIFWYYYFHYFNFNSTTVNVATLLLNYYAVIMLVFTVRQCFNGIYVPALLATVKVVVGLLTVVNLVLLPFIGGIIGCCTGLLFGCFFCPFLILVSLFIIAFI